MVRRGWLFGAVIVVSDSARVRGVLEGVYSALGTGWNPETVGAITDLVSSVTTDQVAQAVLDAYADRFDLVPNEWPAAVLAGARDRVADHVL
ncbi:hypothetical protein EH165_01285 [Nakamurella antarctica]|uniref:Uncharacterized protein n=1 Tax=Nakamurella antarctica TaxID=1902245 RepID=A0A3G8ZHZ2_9ACTN|nr:hypothetical protein [Nakamurella antarctica]AZI57002.1 hypothetical protein EH165_01285 [Nakamurella antarctica]